MLNTRSLTHRRTRTGRTRHFGAGWRALRVTVSWTLAFLGAIAPFAAILAIAGYVIYRSRRRLIRRRPTAQPASPES